MKQNPTHRHPLALAALVCAAIVLAPLLCGAPAIAQTADEHVAMGDEAHENLDPEGALRYYQAALELDSDHYESLWRAARSAVDIGKLLEEEKKQEKVRDSLYILAVGYARQAIAANPNGADGHFMLANAVGRVALTKGPRERVRFSKIVRMEALRAVELDSLHDGAYHVLGRWHAEIMRLPGIAKFVAKTFLGGKIFNEASWENAVRYLERAVELRPSDIYHHLDLAEAYVDSDDPDSARPHLRQIPELPVADVMDPLYKQQAAELLQKITEG